MNVSFFASKYKLAFCEFFNSDIHGKNETSSRNIDSHFLILRTLNINTFYDSQHYNSITRFIGNIRRQLLKKLLKPRGLLLREIGKVYR